jgi:hypothetical protein
VSGLSRGTFDWIAQESSFPLTERKKRDEFGYGFYPKCRPKCGSLITLAPALVSETPDVGAVGCPLHAVAERGQRPFVVARPLYVPGEVGRKHQGQVADSEQLGEVVAYPAARASELPR